MYFLSKIQTTLLAASTHVMLSRKWHMNRKPTRIRSIDVNGSVSSTSFSASGNVAEN